MYTRFIPFGFIFLCIVLPFAGEPAPADAQSRPLCLSPDTTWLWPTHASHRISSTFGETRAGHFHAGLDIKTWGRRGYPVYATRSGILYRVGVHPNGYGNVVYLRHADGSFSVYAHLEDFIPEIRHLVDSLRLQTYQFDFDRILTGYHIYFKQGDTIGYTGSSGIGPPHLHFELRTPEEHPFNPFLTNLHVADHRPPYILGLSVEPISMNAEIEGEKQIYTRRPHKTRHGYNFGTITVSGAIGLGIEAGDHSDKVSNSYAVYRLSLKMDSTVYFSSEVDSFSYNKTHQLNLDRIYRLLKYHGEAYQRLYVKDGNTLPFYSHLKNHGIIDLPDGSYHFTITASDYFGNTSRAYVTLVFQNIKGNQLATADPPSSDNRNRRWFWADDWVSIPVWQTIFPENTTGGPHPGKILIEGDQRILDLRGHPRINIRLPDRVATLYRVYPGQSRTIYSDDGTISAGFGRTSVYDTLSVFLNNGLRHNLPWFSILPDIEPLKGHIYISIKLDDRTRHKRNLAVYLEDERKSSRYHFIPSATTNGYLNARIGDFGTYQVLQDTVAPQVSHPRLVKRHGHWLIALNVKDNLSGLDNDRTVIYCNNVRGIPDFDEEGSRILYYRPDFEPKSVNHLEITVYDQIGNHRTVRFAVAR